MRQLKTYDVVFTARIATYEETIDSSLLLERLREEMEANSQSRSVGLYLFDGASIELKEKV